MLGFGWGAFGLLGPKQKLDFDQVMVAVEACSRYGVDVVDNVSPAFVDDRVVELDQILVTLLGFLCMCLCRGGFSIQLCGRQ